MAIFFASERPPHQAMSSIATLTAWRSKSSRKAQRVPSVSLAVTRTFVRRAVVGERLEVGHLDRILEPVRPVRRERLRDLDRGRQIPERVELDVDVHVVADRPPDLLERGERLFQVRGRDPRPVRGLRVLVERPDLHAGVALALQRERQLVGAVEEGVEVLVRPAGRRCSGQAPVRGRLHRLRPHVAITGTGVVDADPVAAFAAEQLIERLPRRLAEEVPQRDVDRRGGADLDADRLEPEVPLEEVPAVALDLERVLAEEIRRARFVDLSLDRRDRVEGLAQADEALVGVDADPEDVGELAETDRLDRGDFHRYRTSGTRLGASQWAACRAPSTRAVTWRRRASTDPLPRTLLRGPTAPASSPPCPARGSARRP